MERRLYRLLKRTSSGSSPSTGLNNSAAARVEIWEEETGRELAVLAGFGSSMVLVLREGAGGVLLGPSGRAGLWL